MDIDAEREVTPELHRGERLLWAGRPRQGLRLVAGDALMIPFSLLWAGFAFFWEWSVIENGGPLFMVLWGIPFILAGIYIVIGRFFVDALRRARTWYGITDERVVIVSGWPSRKVEGMLLSSLGQVSVRERADRSGDLELGPSHGLSSMFTSAGWPGSRRHAPPTLEAIESVRDVHELIRTARQARSEPRATA